MFEDLHRLFKENHYDLIYLNSDTAAKILYCLYPRLKQHKPIIIHCHSSGGQKRNHLVMQPLMNRICNYKIACSEKAAKWMFGEKHYKEALIIPNGVDTQRFQFDKGSRIKIRNELGITEEECLLGHVGRLTHVKNHRFIIELIEALPSNFRAIFIGDGELKDELELLIKEKNMTARIVLLSARGNVEEYYSAMDCFVMPSFFEGLPIVAVEAQCSGLPCLLSENISRMSSVSDNCYFFPLSVEDWASFIKTKELRRYDGVKCVKGANLSIDNQVKTICKVFDGFGK